MFGVGISKHAKFQVLRSMQRFGLRGRDEPKMELIEWASKLDGESNGRSLSKAEAGVMSPRTRHVEHENHSDASVSSS